MAENFVPSFPVCEQCGFSHPLVAQGSKCPMAKSKIGGVEIDLNIYFVRLKPVLLANIEKNKIKNLDKLFSNLVVITQKYLETYKE